MVCHSTSLFFLSTVFYGFQCTNLPVPNEPFPLPCLGPLESGIGKMGSWREWMFFPPLCTYSLVTCSTGAVGHALHLCHKWAPYWEFSLNLSVHSTIEMSTSTLPMPGLGSRDPCIPTCEWSYQAIKLSGVNKQTNQNRQLVAFSWSLKLLELNFPV